MQALKIIEPKNMPLPRPIPKHIPLPKPGIYHPVYAPKPEHPDIDRVYQRVPVPEPVHALYVN